MRVTPNLDTIRTFFVSAATNVQYMPDITFGSGNYLVVWADGRTAGYPIYAARVTPSGTVLDGNGIRVSMTTTNQYSPSVCYGNNKYFTVWGYLATPYAVTGRFINPNGTMSDTIRLASATSYIYNTDVAYDGTNYMVVWVEYGVSSTLKGLMVDGNGAPIGSPFTIASSVYYYASLSLCFDGTNYLVTYTLQNGSDYKIWGRKYNRAGSPVGAAFRISNSSSNQYYGFVIPGANNRYLNVWSEYRTTYDIYGNLDILMTGVEEGTTQPKSQLRLKSSIIRNVIQVTGAEGKEIVLFDASGRQLGKTTNGYFNARGLENGVYFLKASSGERFKAVKVQ